MSDKSTPSVHAEQTDKNVDMIDKGSARDPIMGRITFSLTDGTRGPDLGCGPGHCVRRLAAARLRVNAWDAAAQTAAISSGQRGVTARQAVFDSVEATAHYHGIWAYFSLLQTPGDAITPHLSGIARALKPDGGRDRLWRHYECAEKPGLEEHLGSTRPTPLRHWSGVGSGFAGHPAARIALKEHG